MHELGKGIGKWFKKNWIGLIVGGCLMGLIVGLAVPIISPHLVGVWPVSVPVVVSVPSSDESMAQATPSLGGVLSSQVSVKNYEVGDEIDGSATIYNDQTTMTSYIIKPVVPSGGLSDDYSAAPADIVNWVTFDTGSTIMIEPNSKETVKIIFKIPSGYKPPLPKNWQFYISVEPQLVSPSSVNTPPPNGLRVNIQTQYLFRWLIDMK